MSFGDLAKQVAYGWCTGANTAFHVYDVPTVRVCTLFSALQLHWLLIYVYRLPE